MSHPKENPAWSRAAFFILAALLVLSTAAFAQPVGGERFTANLVDPAGHFGRVRGSNTAQILIHIDHYSEDAETQRLAGILQQKGPDALRDALWDKEVGYIRVGGGLGYPIAVARSHPAPDGGRIIRLMMDRQLSQREVINNSRTVDYPFTFIEIKVDRNGKGEGQFYQAAKVRLSGDKFEVENYSPQPLRLLAVKAE
ncbi:MAG TPA: hypothetical protein VLB76_15930 [Thermoanaerobaculia bacterium]|jgi:hypothetical protein|nr:hypothetical protein [Thermoanaerobaculia bacterium]